MGLGFIGCGMIEALDSWMSLQGLRSRRSEDPKWATLWWSVRAGG